MFRVVMTSWSLIVEAMRACAQGGSGPNGGRAFAPPKAAGGLGGGTPPNVGSDNEFYAPPAMIASFVIITRCPVAPLPHVSN